MTPIQSPTPPMEDGINPTPFTTSSDDSAREVAFSSWPQRPNPRISIPGVSAVYGDTSSDDYDYIGKSDVVIAVMGPASAGKSSFVDSAAGETEPEAVMDRLRSQTKAVQPTRCLYPDGRRNIVLVDTPGFDSTAHSDTRALEKIADWFKEMYQIGIKLTGILYLHPITSVEMAGTLLKNLAVLNDLCGDRNLRGVVFVTTMWDVVEESLGSEREDKLVSNFWKDMIHLGSRTCRFQGTRESAWEIIGCLDLEGGHQTRTPLRIQREMVDRRLPLDETAAAKTLFCFLEAMVIRRKMVGGNTSNNYHGYVDEDDIVIAVIGPTGTGKSSFVNIAAGRPEAVVGHSFKSQTQAVQPIRCAHPDGRRNIVLVDTPGLDNTHLSDAHVLQMIASWFKESYRDGFKLTGILYLHRITDRRMGTTSRNNLVALRNLCGDESLKNVILVTTMWDELEDESIGSKMEVELSTFWKDMMRPGSRTCRFQGTRESAWEIIECLDLEGCHQTRTPLRIQREMVDRHLLFFETTAAETLGYYGTKYWQ